MATVQEPQISTDVLDRVEPDQLENLFEDDASLGQTFTCLNCGETFTEGKRAKNHKVDTGHNDWVRHPTLPSNWDNPYVQLSDIEVS